MKSWERCYVEFLVRIAQPLGNFQKVTLLEFLEL
jgi:hypothetical protein